MVRQNSCKTFNINYISTTHRADVSRIFYIKTWASGGTGRRARLRIWWGNPWRFKSSLAHQFDPEYAVLVGVVVTNKPFSERFSINPA